MTTKKSQRQPRISTAFEQLVHEVAKNNLKPVEAVTGLDEALDSYIKEYDMHMVMRGVATKYYYIKYHDEWMALSWYELRRICPFIFKQADDYKVLQAPLLNRLKLSGRVFGRAKMIAVEFE